MDNYTSEEITALLQQIPRLTTTISELQVQVTHLATLAEENTQLRSKVAHLEAALSKALNSKDQTKKNSQANSKTSQPPATNPPATTPPASNGTSASSWATVGAKRPSPSNNSTRKRAAKARHYQVNNGPKGYDYIYLHLSKRLTRGVIRSDLASFGIEKSRVLDISFPCRSVAGLLVHVQYIPALLELLSTAKIDVLQGFDPTNPDLLGDPSLSTLSRDQKVTEMQHIMNERCIRVVKYLRPSVAPSVARFFVEIGWLNEEDAQATLDDKNSSNYSGSGDQDMNDAASVSSSAPTSTEL